MVEIRETVVNVPRFVEIETPVAPAPPLFARLSADELLAYGVPADWLAEVRTATEDSLLALASHLPAEAAEALLDLAVGVTPKPAAPAPTGTSPFEHPDALRRFRVMGNVEDLAQALDYPWDKWTVFLHPAQRALVEKRFQGPARVAGSAGTGKTIVALHRAVWLARQHPGSRVLLATFSDTLATALRARLVRLIGQTPRLGDQIEVFSMNALGRRLYEAKFGHRASLASPGVIEELMQHAAAGQSKWPLRFLLSEWHSVVDAWQIDEWPAYRDVRRLGRRTRLPEPQRQQLWEIFERLQAGLRDNGLITYARLFARLGAIFSAEPNRPFDFAVIDEAQDIDLGQLRFLASLLGPVPEGLFFAGDTGQRIFQPPFSWLSAGVDIRGRSTTLRINYRTSHQIRAQADRLLDPEISDVDGNVEQRNTTVSLFNGPTPEIRVFPNVATETEAVAAWLAARRAEGLAAHEMAVFVRTQAEVPRARAAVEQAGLAANALDAQVETVLDRVSIGTMHLAKGLEFRAVAVVACDAEVIPLQERVESAGDEAELEEVYATERHLLYVACTRARDHLLVSAVKPASEFLADLQS